MILDFSINVSKDYFIIRYSLIIIRNSKKDFEKLIAS